MGLGGVNEDQAASENPQRENNGSDLEPADLSEKQHGGPFRRRESTSR